MAESDVAVAKSATWDESAKTDAPKAPVVCEPLYFVQNKSDVLPFDSIVSICADFYQLTELEDARLLLVNLVPQYKRLPRHTGTEEVKRRKTASDLVKICLDPSLSLPMFCSSNIQRVPPVGLEHVDVSALLQEVAALRAEVRSIANIRTEVATIHGIVTEVRETALITPGTAVIDSGYGSSAASDGTISRDARQDQTGVGSFAALASELRNSGVREKPKAAKIRQPVVGRATTSKLKTVATRRDIDIFVSRIHPSTEVSDMQDCVKDILGTDYSSKTECIKLQSKYEELYSSFHICVNVNVDNFKNVLEVLNAPESWPEGALVRRYFKPRNG